MILKVDDAIYYTGTTGNILTISLDNDVSLCGLQFDLLFDPEFFTIDALSLASTDRTLGIGVFHAWNPEPGLIKFAYGCVGAEIWIGTGPIYQFDVDVSEDCPEGDHFFVLTNTKIGDSTGSECKHDALSGTITVKSSIVLSIEDRVVFQNSQDNVISINLDDESQDALICAAEISILYDTTCFEVTSVEPTNRTRVLSIFQYADRDSGIQIAMTGLGACILKGMGPIAKMNVNVSDCPEGFYSWNISNAKLYDAGGNIIPFIEIDGNIAIYEFARGDINEDSELNALDVVLAIRIAIGQNPDPSEREVQAADCNLDGQVNIADVMGIVNMITGLGICLP